MPQQIWILGSRTIGPPISREKSGPACGEKVHVVLLCSKAPQL